MTPADLSTSDLAKLRALADSGAIRCPLTEASLRAHGFGEFAAALAASLGFETRSALVLALDLLLEERRRAERAPLELVWTGPDTTSPEARDTAVALGELCGRAQRRLLIAGYRFTHGATILRPVYEALLRGVDARMFLNVDEGAANDGDVARHASAWLDSFLDQNWPFGPPYPRFFHDPRTSRRGGMVLLHAKCAVADGRHALVTSANFTDFGQTRHIEVGVLIDDGAFARRLEAQFNRLVAQRALIEM